MDLKMSGTAMLNKSLFLFLNWIKKNLFANLGFKNCFLKWDFESLIIFCEIQHGFEVFINGLIINFKCFNFKLNC